MQFLPLSAIRLDTMIRQHAGMRGVVDPQRDAACENPIHTDNTDAAVTDNAPVGEHAG